MMLSRYLAFSLNVDVVESSHGSQFCLYTICGNAIQLMSAYWLYAWIFEEDVCHVLKFYGYIIFNITKDVFSQ